MEYVLHDKQYKTDGSGLIVSSLVLALTRLRRISSYETTVVHFYRILKKFIQ